MERARFRQPHVIAWRLPFRNDSWIGHQKQTGAARVYEAEEARVKSLDAARHKPSTYTAGARFTGRRNRAISA
jgi:hypothetical protein